ncbi:hypothetical protein D9757_011840 [Collybiopsis confluens]|uniref:RING-type domain-containing protein n=1 Tax=Collybiopsis confluens TaxID=2823264 RepID=A0A8H5H0Y2_9AGAR|nr:hypothetical protein D9757_011840 [Collybiopsis confluens]
MADEYYEVGFVRCAQLDDKNNWQYQIHWLGWDDDNETLEPGRSVAAAGQALTDFWISLGADIIFSDHAANEVLAGSEKFMKKQIGECTAKEKALPLNPGPASIVPHVSGSIVPGTATSEIAPEIEIPFPEKPVADPRILWLPPDRIGLQADGREDNFQMACNALASIGLDGREFYIHVKKDRKELSETWYNEEECIICQINTGVQTIPTCKCRAKGFCRTCTVALLEQARSKDQHLQNGIACPICRKNVFLVAREWLYVHDSAARAAQMRIAKARRDKARRPQRRKNKQLNKKKKTSSSANEGELKFIYSCLQNIRRGNFFSMRSIFRVHLPAPIFQHAYSSQLVVFPKDFAILQSTHS